MKAKHQKSIISQRNRLEDNGDLFASTRTVKIRLIPVSVKQKCPLLISKNRSCKPLKCAAIPRERRRAALKIANQINNVDTVYGA